MKPLMSVEGWLVRDSGGCVKFVANEKPYRTFHTDISEKNGIERKTGYWRNDLLESVYFSELGISQDDINELLPELEWSSEPQPFTLELWKKEG